MHTQNTQVHIKLWHREFWHLALANMLLTMAVYMLIPVLPLFLLSMATPLQTAVCMGIYAVGLYSLGGFCSYLVQRYRRNTVCLIAIMAMVACIGIMYYVSDNIVAVEKQWWIVAFARLLLGATFGLAQMVLMSTLIIDTCESFQRTEANHSSAWFGRLALSLGPVVAIVVNNHYGFRGVIVASLICCILAMFLIKLVHFPFRAPEDNICTFSLDRFFLPQGIWLFINLAMTTTAIGMLLSMEHSIMFYGMMMIGFFMALLAQRFVFVNAELKSEVITGLLLIAAAILMTYFGHRVASRMAPVLIGLGIGIIGARYLLFFIKLSRHCQRGTSQSTYILAWETGLASGLFIGYAFFNSHAGNLLVIALVLVIISMAMYNFFTHDWYVRTKNR